MIVEQLEELGEVGERAGEAIDFVDDDDVDAPRGDIVQQPFQGRALHAAAGEAPIIVAVAA